MKKRFPYYQDRSVLIAQDDRYDFYLWFESAGLALIVGRGEKHLTVMVRADLAYLYPDFNAAVAALKSAGLLS